jgi:hypothetical protein
VINNPSRSIAMRTRTDLTQTQQNLLDAAIAHPKGRLVFPDSLRGGARQKVINALVAEDLIDADGEGWCLTEQGYNAMGFAPPDAASDRAQPLDDTVPTREVGERPEAIDPADPEIEAAVASIEAQAPTEVPPAPVKTRADSKQATVIRMLRRPEGATLDQLVEATGWQKHTVRGCLAGALKKKLGMTLTSAKESGGDRVYRAA